MATRTVVAGLDRDRIVDAALALVDREGAGALSMRRVAGELRAGTMSLYNHVADKADLERLVLERVLAGLRYEPAADAAGAGRDFAHAVRNAFLAHPATIVLLGTGAGPEPMVQGLAASHDDLVARGLDAGTAVQMIGAVSRYVIGSLLGELFGPAASRSRAERDRAFDFGLDAMFLGFARMVESDAEEPR